MRLAASGAGLAAAVTLEGLAPAAPTPAVLLEPVPAAAPVPVAADEDPFAMFGGPPPPVSTSAAPAVVADVDDGFLAAFVAPAAALQQQQQQAGPVEPKVTSGDFGDFWGSEDREAPAPPAPSAAAAVLPPSGSSFSSAARPPAVPAHASPTASFGYERPPSSGAQPRYRVFDFVEPQSDSPPRATAGAAAGPDPGWPSSHGRLQQPGAIDSPLEDGLRRASGSSSAAGAGGVLHAASYEQGQAGPKEVVSDLGHKAAKALQSGTKWFMRASKTLVNQVQQRLEHPGGAGSAGGGAAGRWAPHLAARECIWLGINC